MLQLGHGAVLSFFSVFKNDVTCCQKDIIDILLGVKFKWMCYIFVLIKLDYVLHHVSILNDSCYVTKK